VARVTDSPSRAWPPRTRASPSPPDGLLRTIPDALFGMDGW